MENRTGLPALFEGVNKIGVGAEVGVYKGEFTLQIFTEWNGVVLLVDSWQEEVPGMDMQGAYNDAKTNLAYYSKMVAILKKDSMEAVKEVPDGTLDWVYIDADHTYDAITKDIAAWADKVRYGGIVSGHDYFDGMHAGIDFGVKKAVDEYVNKFGYLLNVTTEQDFKSWWFVKENK